MHEFSIGQWLIALLIVLAILGARRLRRFRNERRQVPLGAQGVK